MTWCSGTAEDTLQAVLNFFELVHNVHGYYPHILRCDRGSNYTAKSFQRAIKEFGVLLQYADPGTHGQNGFAEKRIDTIEVRANASLTTAGLEKKYLVDAINYVVAIDNRLPTFADRCPYDIFFQPTLQKAHRLKLAPFGCRTLALRPVHLRRKKEGIRRDECVLLGLADGSKRGSASYGNTENDYSW